MTGNPIEAKRKQLSKADRMLTEQSIEAKIAAKMAGPEQPKQTLLASQSRQKMVRQIMSTERQRRLHGT